MKENRVGNGHKVCLIDPVTGDIGTHCGRPRFQDSRETHDPERISCPKCIRRFLVSHHILGL